MKRPSTRVALVATLACLFAATGRVSAQAAAERVQFTTVDGVKLRGHFYTGKPRYAAVILLHAWETETSRTKAWVTLAESLQKAGYSVLSFDFRGHGESTTFDEEFWKYPNSTYLNNPKAVKKAEAIEVKDFKKDYMPLLINDIAAAKAFLDRKNDTGACNTGSTVLIGAEEGATLGAIWLNSEWHRHKMVVNMFKMGMMPAADPEGRDVCACIWLSISPKLGNHAFSLAKTLYLPGKSQETPMTFMVGENDKASVKTSKDLTTYIKPEKDAAKGKLKFTGMVEVKGTKLAGSALLKLKDTDKNIIQWMDEVVVAKGKEWEERDFRKTQYYWRSPMGGKMIPAKVHPMEMNMAFDTYFMYMKK